MTDPLIDRIERLGAAMRPTPLVALRHERVDLYLKLESSNPTGSTKDRSAYAILCEAARAGLIAPGTTVVESSSGNFAVSLTTPCRYLGLRFVPVIDPTINVPTERLLRLGCDRVEKVVTGDEHRFLTRRLDVVQQLRAEDPGAYWPNQYANPAAACGHFEFTGAQLCADLPTVDYVFVGVGTGATLAGFSQRIKRDRPVAKVIAVDTEGSVIFGGAAGRRRIPGIGSSIQPGLVEQAIVDDVVRVSERDTVLTCRRLVRDTGLYVGGSTGSVLAAIDQYFAGCRGRPIVAFLCADHGTAYTDTIYDKRWVRDELGLDLAPQLASISC
ncbi:2,3-diaminopropionate biosynthesis protein SbnA [Plantactinospora sp. WMMB334]|uniref:2,3-diaminopropionate biosynthesis protein SbnA n=1 Tax=Plantactinospora sp. WMMB334 TaxID=3404119 RepID=UPI003B9515A8